MNEQEWSNCTDPVAMLMVEVPDVYDLNGRKQLLFGCACGRRIWEHLPEAYRHWVEVGEQVADGLAGKEMWDRAEDEADESGIVVSFGTRLKSDMAFYLRYSEFAFIAYRLLGQAELVAQSNLIREIHGNPFHPVALNSRWLTQAVTTLATAIYDAQAFDRLPVLADALEEAGCDNDDILNHCRSSGPHVRGCWVVDLLLGKS